MSGFMVVRTLVTVGRTDETVLSQELFVVVPTERVPNPEIDYE